MTRPPLWPNKNGLPSPGTQPSRACSRAYFVAEAAAYAVSAAALVVVKGPTRVVKVVKVVEKVVEKRMLSVEMIVVRVVNRAVNAINSQTRISFA
jgi:hypothetical protein